MTETDGPLRGGTANYGRIYRVGDTVHRPRGRHTPAVHDLLRHLADRDFAGAPRVVELGDEHEVLRYVEGYAANEPLASWARTDDALASVGELLRTFHAASKGFDPTGRAWQREVPVRWRAGRVSHNDVNPGNVIFRDGQAVALIDFDLAGTGSCAWDLAVAACCWVPLRDSSDPLGGADANEGSDEQDGERAAARMKVLLDGYGADRDLRARTLDACRDANEWIATVIREASERGHPAFGRLWQARAAMYRRADRWLAERHDELRDAVV